MLTIAPMFRVDFGTAAAGTIAERVPNDTVFKAIEMLRSIGETAAAMDTAGPLDLSLSVDSFLFHYTLDAEARAISIFSILPRVG